MTEPVGESASAVPPMPSTPPKTTNLRRSFLVGAAAGVLTSSLVAGGVFLATRDSEPRMASADSTPTTTASGVAQEAVEEETEPIEAYNEVPVTGDFKILLKTTSKQCFGSAGCNVTVDPELTYAGLLPPHPDKTYSITFEVKGGEDGAVIQTMELTSQDSVSYRPVSLSTTTSGAKLTAEVTDVEISG